MNCSTPAITPPAESHVAPMIAITGGIGSGKSAVCRLLSAIGLEVYDCDSRAKALMDSDREIHRRLRLEIAPEVVADGVIDRPLLASIVFSDPGKLAALNAIVHHRVTEDILRWREEHRAEPVLFVETAILLESNLHIHMDGVWLVEADEELRLQRACMRDGADPEAIRSRMKAQRKVSQSDLRCALHIIDNNGTAPLLPQVFELLSPMGISPETVRQWKG